jgi:hypothetical protein
MSLRPRSWGGGWGDEAASRTEAEADAQAEAEARDEGQAPAGNGEHLARKSLMAYVANVSDEQLHDLDPARVQARQRLNWTLREQSLFDPVGKRSGR